MGYTALHPAWPTNIAQEWAKFETATPGLTERLLAYEEIADKFNPCAPHYNLGAIGVDPAAQNGHGTLGTNTRVLLRQRAGANVGR